MESLPDPAMTKVLVKPRVGARTVSLWELTSSKPKLFSSTNAYSDSSTAHVITNTHDAPEEIRQLVAKGIPTTANNEAILFSNILDANSRLCNYALVDLPHTNKEYYSRHELNHIALGTYMAFRGCVRMGWTRVVTAMSGVDMESINFLQILSAWLAGIHVIHFVVRDAERYDAFDFYKIPIRPSFYAHTASIVTGIPKVKNLYLREEEVSWNARPPRARDFIGFEYVDTEGIQVYVLAVVDKVSPSYVIKFGVLESFEASPGDLDPYLVDSLVPDPNGTSYKWSGLLKPSSGGKYNYEGSVVSVYTLFHPDTL